jgi:hypothetical protein
MGRQRVVDTNLSQDVSSWGNFLRRKLLGLAVDGRVRMLRSLARRRQKMHGVWKYGVGRVVRGYRVKSPHPMYFFPSSG